MSIEETTMNDKEERRRRKRRRRRRRRIFTLAQRLIQAMTLYRLMLLRWTLSRLYP